AEARAQQERATAAATAAKASAPAPAPAVTSIAPVDSSVQGKDQKLAELLRRYRANEITPREYHEQRSRVLAGGDITPAAPIQIATPAPAHPAVAVDTQKEAESKAAQKALAEARRAKAAQDKAQREAEAKSRVAQEQANRQEAARQAALAAKQAETDPLVKALRSKAKEIAASPAPAPVAAAQPSATDVAYANRLSKMEEERTAAAHKEAARVQQTTRVAAAAPATASSTVATPHSTATPTSLDAILLAVRQKQAELQSGGLKAEVTPIATTTPAPTPAPVAAQAEAPAVQPATATTPATAVPTTGLTKEQRVAELLRRYKAEEISALEYRMERAKVLSEP
ncbi:MAG: hypothetical protein ACXWC8_09000, partial [Limisphaerales bacterium]